MWPLLYLIECTKRGHKRRCHETDEVHICIYLFRLITVACCAVSSCWYCSTWWLSFHSVYAGVEQTYARVSLCLYSMSYLFLLLSHSLIGLLPVQYRQCTFTCLRCKVDQVNSSPKILTYTYVCTAVVCLETLVLQDKYLNINLFLDRYWDKTFYLDAEIELCF